MEIDLPSILDLPPGTYAHSHPDRGSVALPPPPSRPGTWSRWSLRAIQSSDSAFPSDSHKLPAHNIFTLHFFFKMS